MKRARAVIGACFGDEGKGLMVDYFCRQAKDLPIVVRYNGGAQAGHTVVTASGERHVFHHFGAGTLAGAHTFLSKHFLVNPHACRQEAFELMWSDILIPLLFIHHEARVTTIYDMFVNQKLEEARTQRHGSCGMGVHETMMRHEKIPFVAFDLVTPAKLEYILRQIQQHTKDRLQQIGLASDENIQWVDKEENLQMFIYECKQMRNHSVFTDNGHLNVYKSNVVFEGAQGLLLDQDNEQFFPHVTHSKTGLKNILEIAADTGIDVIDTTYVCRSYLTRHGAGMLPNEDPKLSFEDNTNVTNPWQQNLRFAPQNYKLVSDTICNDLKETGSTPLAVFPDLAITHLDQCAHVGKTCIPTVYESYGTTAEHVKDIIRCRQPVTSFAG